MQSRRLTDFQPKLCPCIECPLLMMALIIRFCQKKFISTSIKAKLMDIRFLCIRSSRLNLTHMGVLSGS